MVKKLNNQALFEDVSVLIISLCPPYVSTMNVVNVFLQLTATCTVLTSGLEMSLEAMHSYDPDCSLVMAVSSRCSPSVTNL